MILKKSKFGQATSLKNIPFAEKELFLMNEKLFNTIVLMIKTLEVVAEICKIKDLF